MNGFFWKIKCTLQFICLLPATILVWVFYILPMWLIFRDLIWGGWISFGIVEFSLAQKWVEPWHARRWRDWSGWGGPCVIICKPLLDPEVLDRARIHEMTHCTQQFNWGLLFYPAYLCVSVWIWLFGGSNKNAYYNNCFEIAARKAAGQLVDIPKERWKSGDRWPWW